MSESDSNSNDKKSNVLSFPQNRVKSKTPSQPTTAPTFRDFAMQIQQADLPGAGQSLSYLFGLDFKMGLEAANHFFNLLKDDPTIMEKAMRIRVEIEEDNPNNAILLLGECFGLMGPYAVQAFSRLRQELDKASNT